MTVAVCLSASLLGPSRGHAVRKAAIHRGGSTDGHGRDTRGGGGWTICLEWAALRSMRRGRATRLQTGRHTFRSGGQIHGHPSTHSPDNSMGTLRSSPSRVRPGNGRAPRYSTHLDRSDATSSSNLVISFRGRSHTIRSPSLTCFQDDVLAGVFCLVLSRQPYAGGLAHYGSTDMVDATQAARVRTSRRAPCSGGQLHRHPRAHPPAPQMSLLQR